MTQLACTKNVGLVKIIEMNRRKLGNWASPCILASKGSYLTRIPLVDNYANGGCGALQWLELWDFGTKETRES